MHKPSVPGKKINTHLFVRMSIWLRSLPRLSAILSICFLGRSDKRRILCFLQTYTKGIIGKNKYRTLSLCSIYGHSKKKKSDYLAVAVPKRIANSWYLFNCFSMKFRWLLTPQIMIWSASRTCIWAPSLSFSILFCPIGSQEDAVEM